eukprot:CAMPEP_0194360138 /NCGR_PEP_ID=MMETSP0174-20130528/7417_1 /TAXON_ID=216777 /ORGANISM="Proboscia alata, Strain PI-D3" /LENGTH=372 /DNA_ID=CAMNT_0039131429 /DNA_START=137 /DNA_END=1255 /DNA_ORIENTATION=+
MAMGAGGKEESEANFRLLLLVLMVLQNSSTVLVGRYTRTLVEKSELYLVNHLIIVTELGKMFLSFILEYHTTNGQLLSSMKRNIIDRPLDFLRILVPALLYLIQNTLLYTALSNLSAPLFQVTYQSKLLTTAIVSVFMLNRKYTFQQWVCLGTLGVGVAIVVLGEKKKSSEGDDLSNELNDAPEQSLKIGLVAVAISCLSSALAGVYFEKVVKNVGISDGSAPVSLWMRNIQMSFFSIIIAVLQKAYNENKALTDGDEDGILEKPFMFGFTAWVWVLICLQSGGGLLVAAVIKYADNVLKGLATGVSVVFATACSFVLFGTVIGLQFVVGATTILGSVWFFSNGAASKGTAASTSSAALAEPSVEMKPILPR